jgi:hypothetical protein
MQYSMTNARMINDNMLACDVYDSNGKLAGNVFLGTHYRQATAATGDGMPPHAIASRVFATARALRFLALPRSWNAFITNGVINPMKRIPVPSSVALWNAERSK